MNGDNYRRAVRAFQQANNLPATGILDADTWNALTSNASGPVLKPIRSPTRTSPDRLTSRFPWI
jgi:peptidoglycan hydrolase-like protein with peptidoglycan-binding domain